MIDWHARYQQQAAWTRPLREYLFERYRREGDRRILEVGCGTGAILSEPSCQPFSTHGLDRDPRSLAQALRHAPRAQLARADALSLPYASRVFDISFCHFLLLWVGEPERVLREMTRVTRRAGYVLALAEPDYLQRVDRPAALASLGQWQTRALLDQGANPGLGSRLAELFVRAGLELVESGPLQASLVVDTDADLEWQVLEHDLAGLVPAVQIAKWRQIDRRARQQGERILYVPTYFAVGRTPG